MVVFLINFMVCVQVAMEEEVIQHTIWEIVTELNTTGFSIVFLQVSRDGYVQTTIYLQLLQDI
jgi:hypothetical protein